MALGLAVGNLLRAAGRPRPLLAVRVANGDAVLVDQPGAPVDRMERTRIESRQSDLVADGRRIVFGFEIDEIIGAGGVGDPNGDLVIAHEVTGRGQRVGVGLGETQRIAGVPRASVDVIDPALSRSEDEQGIVRAIGTGRPAAIVERDEGAVGSVDFDQRIEERHAARPVAGRGEADVVGDARLKLHSDPVLIAGNVDRRDQCGSANGDAGGRARVVRDVRSAKQADEGDFRRVLGRGCGQFMANAVGGKCRVILLELQG